MRALSEGLKQYLDLRASNIIHNCHGAPLLYTLSSDGTPLSYRVRNVIKLMQKQQVREGCCSHEFLVQQAYLRTYTEGGTPLPQCCCRILCH